MSYLLDIAAAITSDIVIPIIGAVLTKKISGDDGEDRGGNSSNSSELHIAIFRGSANTDQTWLAITVGFFVYVICIILFQYYLSFDLLCNIISVALLSYGYRHLVCQAGKQNILQYKRFCVIYFICNMACLVVFMCIHDDIYIYFDMLQNDGVDELLLNLPDRFMVLLMCATIGGRLLLTIKSAYLSYIARRHTERLSICLHRLFWIFGVLTLASVGFGILAVVTH